MSQIKNIKELQKKIETIITNWSFEINKEDITKLNLLILDEIKIDYFGSKTSVRYLVRIERQGGDKVFLFPFDPQSLNKIYQGLIDYKIPWNIQLQKERILLQLPLITTQKKNQIIKKWKESYEKCRIQIRHARHQLLNYWKNEENLNKENLTSKQKEIQKIIDQEIKKLDQIFKTKQDHLLKV